MLLFNVHPFGDTLRVRLHPQAAHGVVAPRLKGKAIQDQSV